MPKGQFGVRKGDPKVPGSGRKKGSQNKATKEIKEMARSLLEDPVYKRNLKARLKAGELAPQLESLLYAYGYGKPATKLEVDTGPKLADLIRGSLAYDEEDSE